MYLRIIKKHNIKKFIKFRDLIKDFYKSDTLINHDKTP